MALLTCAYPTAGTVVTPAAVSASDTISGNDIAAGAILIINCAGTSDNVTIVDPGHTAAGNTGTQAPQTIAINTSRSWGPRTLANYIDPATNLVTVTHSAITNVTWQLVADGD
jgi:NADPH-dependent 2,4-dienoyl-CoA reductase/sulfur reductase-like enzyme